MWNIRKLVNSLAGSTMCFGDPVRAGDRVVLPISRVRAAGGGGFGDGDSPTEDGGRSVGSGGGGGGYVDAAPVGFIEIGPDGARFEAIPDPITTARALSTATATLLAAAAGVRMLRRGRGRKALPVAARLLRRG
jgi:uncharacterized spore protein YtfJ